MHLRRASNKNHMEISQYQKDTLKMIETHDYATKISQKLNEEKHFKTEKVYLKEFFGLIFFLACHTISSIDALNMIGIECFRYY